MIAGVNVTAHIGHSSPKLTSGSRARRVLAQKLHSIKFILFMEITRHRRYAPRCVDLSSIARKERKKIAASATFAASMPRDRSFILRGMFPMSPMTVVRGWH